ncbi:hypothetical protein BGZ65_006218 [Modicella reniformis]|uniref:Uncharacterized protein n=1 Tax=Modicella reniformis TaxID=1440133 RepID=A0A9P6MG37_9FUNG|nr:hypothetical protein BGZ65_006218 [Modicella reniformis]
MHANPVQEYPQQQQQPELTEATGMSTGKEAAELKSSTQDLQGFDNPEEYDNSESDDDDVPQKSAPKTKAKAKKRSLENIAPPLPGFGNPLFEKESAICVRIVLVPTVEDQVVMD